MNSFIRAQNTPVLVRGAVYEGTWTADALAAPSVCWDGTQFVMTVSVWDSSKYILGQWASAFFTSPDLTTWTYVSGSLLIPPVGKYINGNAGLAWFNGKYYFATNIYDKFDPVSTIPVAIWYSTDLINWTVVNSAVVTGYADPGLAVNPTSGNLELWVIDATTREIVFLDSPDAVTWTNNGVYLTAPAWAATGFGEPQPYFNGAGRWLTFDGATSDGKRFVNRVYSAAGDTSWVTKGSVLGANPFNAYENTQVFDGCVIGPFDLGQGPRYYLFYAGSDIVALTDNTNSSIGLAYALP